MIQNFEINSISMKTLANTTPPCSARQSAGYRLVSSLEDKRPLDNICIASAEILKINTQHRYTIINNMPTLYTISAEKTN